MDWRAAAAKKIADCDYSEKGLTLEKLARRLGLSAHHLGRLFRDETGTAFHRYLLAVRMTKACDFLEDPRLSLREVAFRVGYEDVSNFCRAFRLTFGETPRNFSNKRRLTLAMRTSEFTEYDGSCPNLSPKHRPYKPR
jgi:AraC-like DNA-binding protein